MSASSREKVPARSSGFARHETIQVKYTNQNVANPLDWLRETYNAFGLGKCGVRERKRLVAPCHDVCGANALK
jgi:hypothetical protein